MVQKNKTARYRPDIFEVSTIEQAKKIILTPEDGLTPEQRWERETPLLTADLLRVFSPEPGSLIVDYGCGIGRLAKGLIADGGCAVLGVDISVRMRMLSHGYVDHAAFACTSRNGLLNMVNHGLQADHAYAVWVLQHSAEPKQDIDLLWQVLKPGGSLLVVNANRRVVPSDKGWVNDGLDIRALLDERFQKSEPVTLTKGAITDRASQSAFAIRVFK